MRTDSMLVVNANIGNREVHELTKILFEKRPQIEAYVPQAKNISQPSTENDIHDGAGQYYNRNAPLFINKNEDTLALGLSIALLKFFGSWQLFLLMRSKRKNQADAHNRALARMIRKIEQAKWQEDLKVIRTEMFAIFQVVVKELDHDKIEEKSMQSFSFAWNVALETLHHHENILPNMPEEEANKKIII